MEQGEKRNSSGSKLLSKLDYHLVNYFLCWLITLAKQRISTNIHACMTCPQQSCFLLILLKFSISGKIAVSLQEPENKLLLQTSAKRGKI